MNENWEDDNWEDDDFIVPIVNSSVQLKKLEERRLQEESDYLVAKDLFNEEKNITQVAAEKHITKIQITEKKVFVKRNNITNNEAKQKEASQKIKAAKENKIKEIDTYGENDYYDDYEEYLDYEDKF